MVRVMKAFSNKFSCLKNECNKRKKNTKNNGKKERKKELEKNRRRSE